jgi:hypothetical protein
VEPFLKSAKVPDRIDPLMPFIRSRKVVEVVPGAEREARISPDRKR